PTPAAAPRPAPAGRGAGRWVGAVAVGLLALGAVAIGVMNRGPSPEQSPPKSGPSVAASDPKIVEPPPVPKADVVPQADPSKLALDLGGGVTMEFVRVPAGE